MHLSDPKASRPSLHYSKFKSKFCSSKENGKPLHEAMRGKSSHEEKLARAWGTFVKDKLGNDENTDGSAPIKKLMNSMQSSQSCRLFTLVHDIPSALDPKLK
jgi:hypothetical protein